MWQTPLVLETSARLLRLLSLLQMRRDWSGHDLAERLEVDVRTVRRDVDRLRDLGYPVHSSPGVAGGYRLEAGAHLPPLLLEDEEAVAVAVGLRTAAGGTVAGIEEASIRALAKLEQVLPAQLRRQVNALQSATLPLMPTGPTVDSALLATIAGACRDSDRMRFEYRDRAGKPSIRTVEPNGLVVTGRRWYLLALDIDRADWRTFRVDRIGKVVSTGPRFTPSEPPEDPATFVSRAISAEPYRYQARVKLHAPAETVRQRVSPSAALVRAVDDKTCMLETGAESLDVLAIFIGLAGVDFEVEEPVELREHVAALAERLARSVGTKPEPRGPDCGGWR